MGDTAVVFNGFREAPRAVLDALVGDCLIVLGGSPPPSSLIRVLVQESNYGDALRVGKVRTSPVSETFGARCDFRKFDADESRMRDVIAG